jgi:hypothetical protein
VDLNLSAGIDPALVGLIVASVLRAALAHEPDAGKSVHSEESQRRFGPLRSAITMKNLRPIALKHKNNQAMLSLMSLRIRASYALTLAVQRCLLQLAPVDPNSPLSIATADSETG